MVPLDHESNKRAWVGKGKPFNESEMALFSECSLECARKVLDTADIVREAIFHQLRAGLKREQVQHGTHESVTKDLLSAVLN